MASNRIEDLTLDTRRVVETLIQKAGLRKINVKIASTLRTCEDQAKVYAQGRTAPGGIVSHASGCGSWHTWGRAADIFIIDDNGKTVDESDHRYDEMGDIAKSLGMVWGGDFGWGRDASHFEYHPGLSINDVCPDRSGDMCHEQIAKHNAQNSQPVDVALANAGEQSRGINMGHVIVSAVIGSLVYQGINFWVFGKKRR